MLRPLFEIEGFAELQRKLKTLPERVQKREVKKLMRLAAKPTVQAAKSAAPKKSRTLSKSIGIVSRRSKHRLLKVPSGGVGVYIRPRVGKKLKNDGFYAAFVHDGTKNITRTNPFMEKAYKQTKGQVSVNMEKSIAKSIQKQIEKLSK